jgi:MFS family permease
MNSEILTKNEMKFLLGIGSALALRQLGLLMVMPFLAVYGRELANSTPGLIGLALGIYGLSQAIFQIPFGHWSDRLGRKPVILIGLLILILGLILASWAKDIYFFILARTLQGSGAIMAVAYAWVGDKIASHKRNKGMSIIGMLVGISATLAFIGGPIIYRWLTVPQLFLLCALLAIISWFYILVSLEDDKKTEPSSITVEKTPFRRYLADKNLARIIFAGFFNNYILVSQFFVIPLLLESSLGTEGLWKVFAPATIIAVFAMGIGAKYADAGYFPQVSALSFGIITVSSVAYFSDNPFIIAIGVILFMSGYMCLVTLLPTSVTKLSQKNHRGALTGFFNTCQFIGSFVGGSLTGLLWGINPLYSISLLLIISTVGAILCKYINLKEYPVQ